MPRKKNWKKSKARRVVLEESGGDRNGRSLVDPSGSSPVEGRDGPTDLHGSVPMTASAVRSSGLGTDEPVGRLSVLGVRNTQMEVLSRLFKPSGSSAVIESESEPDTEPVTEPDTEPDTEPVTEPDSEPVTEPDSVHIPEPDSEHIPKPVCEPDSEPVTEPDSEHVTEPSPGLTPKSTGTTIQIESETEYGYGKKDKQKCHKSDDYFTQKDLYYARPVQLTFTSNYNYNSVCRYDANNPFNCSSLLYGSYCQGNSKFSVTSRGSQCTINSLCALIYAHYSNFSSVLILDEVLNVGDQVYKNVLQNLKQLGKFKHRLLSLDEIPEQVNILSRKVHVEKANIITGIAVEQLNNSALPTLHRSLYNAFLNEQYVLVMIGAVCSAVFSKDDQFWLFDSHSHGKHGLSSPDGKSVLMSFATLDDIVTFMYAMYESMKIDLSSQYELLPVKFTISTKESSFSNLLMKYFEDQDSRSALKSNEKSCKMVAETFFSKQKTSEVKHRKANRQNYFRMYRQAKRNDSVFKEREKESQAVLKRKARKDPKYKNREKQNQTVSKRKARNNPIFKESEKKSQLVYKIKVRNDPKYKNQENQNQTVSKRKVRNDPIFKEREKEIQTVSKRKARNDPTFKKSEKESQIVYKRKVRNDPEYKNQENQNQTVSKRKARNDPIFKEMERRIQTTSKRTARANPEYVDKERKLKQNMIQKTRGNPECADKERKRKRKARSNPYVLEKERLTKRSHSNSRAKEQERISDRVRKSNKRKSTEFKQNEKLTVKKKKHGHDIDDCITLFHESIKVGPQFICTCCKQTWFQQSVSNISSIKGVVNSMFLTGTLSVSDLEWICTTCKTNLLNKKVPKLSVANGMRWPEKPDILQLYPLEERLISLRIPFMQVRELPRGRQYSVKGNVVNVPVDIQPVVNALPRPFDENVTVAVKLKKKLSFKSCAFTENVRPLRVLVALHWLMKNSTLYKNSSVQIDEEWATHVTRDSEEIVREFFSLDTKSSDITETHSSHDANNESIHNATYDSDAEENTQENVGNIDTLVDDADMENRTNTFTFAPGEGQRPLSIYQDADSEFLCFPTIYCGQRRIENADRMVPVGYSDIAKWELRSNDRRAANSVPNIFFKLKKIQMKQLHDKVNLAVRRGQFQNKNMTAGQARDLNYTENMVHKDEGYYIFKQLRNSPAYLETKKKDVFAMIRQLGLPTWFMSLSSADTRWSDLINMLSNLNQGFEYSEDEIKNLSWEQTIKLVQKDPVTCSRYFDHRVQQFIKIVLKGPHDCLGQVTDYFYRVEFQQRGSPHIHMLVWVEDSPKYNSSSNGEITKFVDKYVKCCSENASLEDLFQLQIHKHTRTCHKKEDKICRFGYPLPPLNKTMVLEPLESDADKYRKMYEKIQKKMNTEKEGFNMTYEKFLTDVVELNEDDYIKCIRSSLKASKVFLQRTPKDIRVNLYNETVLRAWKANIDIQFVLDPYACAMYIVSYISKSQRGMSALLHAAAKEARNGNLDIKKQVRHIGNVFSNSVEVSAQEAVYLVLQMPLSKSTRDVVFINTSQPNQRIQLLKAKSTLDELPASSTDIVADNVIKRYSRRPKCLENWCLADYVSQLEVVYPNDDETCPANQDVNDDHDDIEPEELFKDDQTLVVLKNGIKIRQRKNHKVIRYVRFNRKSDEENHYREKILLFLPWRNEDRDLIANYETYKHHYETRKHQIDYKSKVYEHHVEELEMARQAAENDNDAVDDIAPGTQQVEAETALEESVESETFVYFNPDRVVEQREYDIGIELGSNSATSSIDVNDNVMSDEQYRELLRCLNTKQRHFYNHVIHWIKTKDAPLHAFLTGGAGVGKSVVIKALYQTLYRYLNLSEGQNADEVRVLLCAYTGKAAYNINGSTISTAFRQKFKQKEQTLNCDTLNTFRSKYRNLSVVIIDEISMVSNSMLKFIDQRLQELTGTRLPFGGKSIIAVGDLFQLKPVAGSWIFQDLTHDASPLATNLWQEHFTMFELTEIMRQKDDSEFAELLNRLRHNQMTDHDKEQIKQCLIDPNSVNYPQNAPHIFAENSFMQLFNDKIIKSLNSQKIEILCHDSIVAANISQERQDRILNQIPRDASSTMGLHYSLTIVIGMIYDLTVNIDTEDGLTNGASCIVKLVEYKQAETTRPSIIWVLFDDERIGNDRRTKYFSRGFYRNSIDKSWTPIFDIERTFTMRHNTIQRIQFPLQPSAGRTVHRAQGTTLDQVVIDLSQRRVRKNPHIHYVALSRVRSIKNLHILNLNEEAISLDERVVVEMERLTSEAKLQLCYTPLDTVNADEHFKVIYNNCRSLHKHFENVAIEQNILSSHIVGFAETRLVQRDKDSDYSINGYQLIRNDQNQSTKTARPPHGLAMYIRDDVAITDCHLYSTTHFEFIVIYAEHRQHKMQIVMVYKSPGLSFNNLISTVNEELVQHLDPTAPLVIMGDFNIDVSQKDRGLEQYMSKTFHCQQLIHEPTTDHGSTLDLVFSNQESSVAGTVETYWSDHKIIYFYTGHSGERLQGHHGPLVLKLSAARCHKHFTKGVPIKKEGVDGIGRKKLKTSIKPLTLVRSSTPTGSDHEDEDMCSEEDDSDQEYTTQEEFTTELILGMMQNLKDGDVEKPFACPVPGCKKRYKNVNGMKYHARHGHRKDTGLFLRVKKAFKCKCGKCYRTAQALRNHMISTHSTTDLLKQQPPRASTPSTGTVSQQVSTSPIITNAIFSVPPSVAQSVQSVLASTDLTTSNLSLVPVTLAKNKLGQIPAPTTLQLLSCPQTELKAVSQDMAND